jgi:ABC-type polysaccharide/polyol phosphate export permease
MTTQSSFASGCEDIGASLQKLQLASMLGWQDVKQRYRRSAVGPFWLTISIGVMVGSIGFVFGQIFGSDMSVYLPFLAAGIVLWSYIAATIADGCNSFISAEPIIKQLPIPLFVHVLRVIWRNFIILLHNLLILPIIYVVFAKSISVEALLFLPGVLVVTVNLAWMTLVLGVLSARYRDLPQIVGSVLQVLYFLTPIVWLTHLLPARAQALLDFNPMFHLVEVARAPLLGSVPTLFNWGVSVAMAIFGWLIALWVFGRFRWRVAYWI